ncbi:MAG: hypothetical protein C0501_21890 [Isosphaera sp.]|nr:hypothetical protein [Isosphaera sp.]
MQRFPARRRGAVPDRAGLSRLQLLVVLLVAGLAAGLVAAGLGQIREDARAASCQNNLRQVGLGTHNYRDTYLRLPSLVDQGQDAPTGNGLPSVFYAIIPYMEAAPTMYRPGRAPPAAYHAHSAVPFHFRHKDGSPGTQDGGDANQARYPFTDPADATATYLRDVPVTLPDGTTGHYAAGSYAANGLIPWGTKWPSNRFENTILFAERPKVCRTGSGEVHNLWGVGFYGPQLPAFAALTPTDPAGLWSTGQVVPVVPYNGLVRSGWDTSPQPPDFPSPVQRVVAGRPCDPRLPGSPHRAGMQVALADASARVFGYDTDPWVFWAACGAGGR